MELLDEKATVGQWVVQFPQTARLFEQLQVDYCCEGGDTLAQACAERQLTCMRRSVAWLKTIEQGFVEDDEVDWSHATLSELCDDIEQTHHEFLRREMPRCPRSLRKLCEHTERGNRSLRKCRKPTNSCATSWSPLHREEQVLFL